jgi:hypothetical protein
MLSFHSYPNSNPNRNPRLIREELNHNNNNEEVGERQGGGECCIWSEKNGVYHSELISRGSGETSMSPEQIGVNKLIKSEPKNFC